MINLFIDTNIYLEFYDHPKKSLEKIAKIIDSIKTNKVTLWLPEQVKNEFDRRREDVLLGKYNKIERLLKELSELKIPTDEKEEFNAIEDEIKEELKKVKKKFKNTSF